jgi:hypothetical protein
MMLDYSDGEGDGKMWWHAAFARWADPAYTCGASALGTRARVGRAVPEMLGGFTSGGRAGDNLIRV